MPGGLASHHAWPYAGESGTRQTEGRRGQGERGRRTFDPSRRDILGAVPLEVFAGELEPVARVVGRVGDDGLHVGNVLGEMDAAEEFDVDVVELEGVDGGECVAAKGVSNDYEMS